ncbi:MAG: diguanylate cyclase [Actinomycetia bacterium]|nr:diguanylate cyclase [Actinomycetes bacterium]
MEGLARLDAALVDLFDGARVVARRRDAHPMALPHVPLPVDIGLDDLGWVVNLEPMHPADRVRAINAWNEVLEEPSGLVEIEVRSRTDDRWHGTRMSYLNLLDDPDWGAVLVIIRDLGLTAAEPIREHRAGVTAKVQNPQWIRQHLDELGQILETTGDVEGIFGRLAEELEGQGILDSIHHDDREAALGMWLGLLGEPGGARVIRQRIVRPDGSFVWIESTVVNELEAAGHVVSISRDIHEQLSLEVTLAERERQLRSLAEDFPSPVFRANPEGGLDLTNDMWVTITGGQTVDNWLDLVHPGDLERVFREWSRAIDILGPTVVEIDFTHADARRRLTLRARLIRSEEGDVESVIGTVDDVTASYARTEELRYRAEHDTLTGLINRRSLDAELRTALTDAWPAVGTVFVDVDSFKKVNDRYGHDVGDVVLQVITQRISQVVRGADRLGRFGGDEFVVLCHGVLGAEDVLAVGRRIVESVSKEPIHVGELSLTATVSVGVAAASGPVDPRGLLTLADHAMYEAKGRGGGCVSLAGPPPESEPAARV